MLHVTGVQDMLLSIISIGLSPFVMDTADGRDCPDIPASHKRCSNVLGQEVSFVYNLRIDC